MYITSRVDLPPIWVLAPDLVFPDCLMPGMRSPLPPLVVVAAFRCSTWGSVITTVLLVFHTYHQSNKNTMEKYGAGAWVTFERRLQSLRQ
jgi:hypothetical protein